MRVRMSALVGGALVSAASFAASVHAQNRAVSLTVDVNADRRAISPLIYGVNHADAAALSDLNCPLNRSGGNNTTRYNWELNADNRGADWYFESLAYASAVPGEAGDSFVSASKAVGAQPMLTVPMIGWVADLGANRQRRCSFSIARYGAQSGSDWQWFPDAGNGIATNGIEIAGNDPLEANVPVDSSFQASWVQHLVGRWGTAANGGVHYYIMDNEPGIWHSTHRDVHPTGATMDEVRDKILDYAAKVKSVDASAQVVGPEEWGWGGYVLSGFDLQYGNLNGWGINPDRTAHGGWDFLPWLLDQLRQRAAASGQRLLDVFSVHYYPQGGEFGNDTSTSMQLRRNRSTRALWDPAYVDESWIGEVVRLVPRLRDWVATYYPGTKTAVTEYNWGAQSHINGATAPSGRARHLRPGGARHGHPVDDAGFFHSDVQGPVTVNLANFSPAGPAQAWQLDASNSIRRLADVALTGGSYVQSVPSQSITLLVVPSGPPGNARPWKPKRKPPQPATPRVIGRGSPAVLPVTGAATARQTAAPLR